MNVPLSISELASLLQFAHTNGRWFSAEHDSIFSESEGSCIEKDVLLLIVFCIINYLDAENQMIQLVSSNTYGDITYF